VAGSSSEGRRVLARHDLWSGNSPHIRAVCIRATRRAQSLVSPSAAERSLSRARASRVRFSLNSSGPMILRRSSSACNSLAASPSDGLAAACGRSRGNARGAGACGSGQMRGGPSRGQSSTCSAYSALLVGSLNQWLGPLEARRIFEPGFPVSSSEVADIWHVPRRAISGLSLGSGPNGWPH